jgi:glycosyltransferase involved in cell wall biosynthesis
VHTNSLKSSLYGGIAGRLARVPVVWHIRDRIADDYLPSPAVRLVKLMARHLPTAVVGNSRATLDTLGPTPAPQAVVPSPVTVTRPRPGPATGRGSELRVGMIGRLAPWKGQHIFLDAFARALPQPGACAVVVGAALFGEERYADELRSQVSALGLDGRVDFRGFRDDIGAELAALDIVVHASVSAEPFGQVVVEAMAMGLPVIAAAAGGPAEIVDHEVTGLLFPPGDIDALARALARLASDAGLRASLGAAGLARARDFRPEVVAPLVEHVYRKLLAAR